jgi:hypothetical protein
MAQMLSPHHWLRTAEATSKALVDNAPMVDDPTSTPARGLPRPSRVESA